MGIIGFYVLQITHFINLSKKRKTSSESFSDDVFLQMFLRFRAPQNHRVPVAEKPVFMFDRMTVHRADVFHARKRADEHQKRGFGQVEIGNMAALVKPYMRSVERVDEELTLKGLALLFARNTGGRP